MVFETLYSTKKAFYYDFFPAKGEEDLPSSRKASAGGMAVERKLIEIRDVYPPPANNSWAMMKTLNQVETSFGKLVVSYGDVFDHVLRYWTTDMANYIVQGQRVGVILWDVTEDRNPKRYQGNEVFLQILVNDDFVLSCMELIRDRKLKVDDEICMYWDSRESCFKFKLVS